MVWTSPPRTWVAGEKPPAATLNLHLRDQFKAIGDAWTSFTPTWTSSTPPVINNGTIDGKWAQAGKLTFVRVVITMGSTTTYGTGSYSITLPADTLVNHQPLKGLLFDTSAGGFYDMVAIRNAASSCALLVEPTTAGNAHRAVSGTVPFTFATGDKIIFSDVYEAA